jgi:uncharacterized membrane protein YfcA
MSLAALVTLVSSQDVLFNVPSELHGASQLWLLIILPVALIAGYLGAVFNKKLDPKYFKPLFCLILIGIIIKEIIVFILLF